MTDEEMAKELVKENVCKICGSGVCGFLIHKCDIALPRYEGVLVGLAEGRKEKETDIFNRWCREEGYECQFLEKLEKENAELKGYKDIVDTIKAEGFETFCDVRMFLQHHKELEEENKRLKQCGTVNIADK